MQFGEAIWYGCCLYLTNKMKKNNKLAIRIEDESNEVQSSTQKQYFPQQLRPITLPDSDEDRVAAQMPQNPGKVIQFQEFLVEDDKEISTKTQNNINRSSQEPIKAYLDSKNSFRPKREFLIDIPQSKTNRSKLNMDSESLQKQAYKQPPAPCNKKSIKAKNFIFPTSNASDEKAQLPPRGDQEPSRINVEQLLRSFDRERQEFYRQKSNFEKELMVKEGQIEMLQRMLTGRIGTEEPLLAQNYQYFQTLILQKDMQINELLERIGELSKQLSSRGEELREVKMEVGRLENINESLMHQLYLLEKKEANKKTTQQFYDLKRQKPNTPTSRGWEYESKKEELRYSGLSDLQKRLQNLKNNRIDLEDRKRIKSELNYTQPARFKPVYDMQSYDYKGKF